jgi:hypothetical protein
MQVKSMAWRDGELISCAIESKYFFVHGLRASGTLKWGQPETIPLHVTALAALALTVRVAPWA